MEWYYAIDGQRLGPVSLHEMARLVAAGTVTADTLVWRAGMAQWQPWRQVAPGVTLPEVPAGELVPVGSAGAQGAAEAGDPELTLESFTAGLETHGFATSVGGVLTRAWATYKAGFWPCLGATLLAYLVMMVIGVLPIIGWLSVVLATPHLTAGLMGYFLRRSRGEPVGIEVLFEGFSLHYGRLALVGLLQLGVALVIGLIFAMGFGAMAAVGHATGSLANGEPPVWALVVIFPLALVIALIAMRFLLVHAVVIDLGLSAIEAYRLSWRITGRRFWTLIGLMLVCFLISLAGMLALLIGVLLVMPLVAASTAQYYEDARESALGRPPAA